MKTLAIGLLIFLLCVSGASASISETDEEFELISIEDLGYTIVPAKSSQNEVAMRTVYSTITQGETNIETQNVNSFCDSLEVDLNWGDTSDSLKLTIFDPSYNKVATLYDSADGNVNGRIYVYIKNSNGVQQGTWRYVVYGYSVSGTEDYSI
jgi:hypothetical protein